VALEALPRAHGQRLTALRSIHGLTQADLAARLDVTQSFLSHLERGSRPVPDTLLFQASREFNLPVSFFTIQLAPAEVGPVTFRKNSRTTARDEGRIVALYDEAARLFRGVSETSGYQAADLPDPADHDDDPELVAEAMRAIAGLGPEDPVLNATRALERFGIGVVDNLDHLNEDARGHTAVSRPSHYNSRPLVALVADVPGAVKRLTVLHEAGHLIFDRDLSGPVSTRSPEEKRAYKFAGAYLLPERVVRRRVSETLNLHGYLTIKADYGISVGAIIIRARDLGVISADRARSLQIQLASQGWRYNEPVPVADETPLLLGQAIRKVYGKQAIAKAAHEIGTAPEWIIQWTHAHVETPSPGPGKVIDLVQRMHARQTGQAI
jgi:Zn-dependent peptidase ImmA (M78 family)/transcriptional regulator with XRE-family HTH domain